MAKKNSKKKPNAKQDKISPATYFMIHAFYALVFLVVFGLCINYCVKSLDRMFLSRNPYFTVAVEDIEVVKDGDITDKEELRTLIQQILTKTDTPALRKDESKHVTNPNVFSLNFRNIKTRIIDFHKHKEIERIDIERTLPNKLRFTIKDREPVAFVYWAHVNNVRHPARFLIDRKGMVLKDDSLHADQKWDNLPRIMGYRPPTNKEGEEIELTVGFTIKDAALHGVLKMLEYKSLHKDGDLCRLNHVRINKEKDAMILSLNKIGRYVSQGCSVKIALCNLLPFSDEKRKAYEGLTPEQVCDREVKRGFYLAIDTIKERISSKQPLKYVDTSQTGVIVK